MRRGVVRHRNQRLARNRRCWFFIYFTPSSRMGLSRCYKQKTHDLRRGFPLAEKEELSKFSFFVFLQGLKPFSKFSDTELAPF